VKFYLMNRRITYVLIVLIFIVHGLLSSSTTLFAARIAKITLKAEEHIRENTPVFISLDSLPVSIKGCSFRLVKIAGSQRIPVPTQIEMGNPAELWWLLPESLHAGEKQVYELTPGKPVDAPSVQIRTDEKTLEIHQTTRKVLSYYHGLLAPPPEKSQLYTRSGFIHPIWSPKGIVLTRIHPGDHIHHLGFWNPWTKAKFEGRKVDFWNLGEGQGTVRFAKFISTTTGPVFGGFEALQQHIDLTAPGDEKVALNEVWEVRVYAQGNRKNGYWMWDFTTTQTCATESPITILKYHYGGFGFRATADWNDKNSHYLTSEGKTRADGNGTRARWCNVFGKTKEGPAGILFLSHPNNHEHPEPMRIWPQGDVYFGFCPVVYGDWEMLPHETYVRRYRVIVYDGTISADEAELFWQSFANPPKIKVTVQPLQ